MLRENRFFVETVSLTSSDVDGECTGMGSVHTRRATLVRQIVAAMKTADEEKNLPRKFLFLIMIMI